MRDTPYLGRRYFRRLSDIELKNWRPNTQALFWERAHNVSAANSEMRRRAAKAGMRSPYEWLAAIAT